MRRKTQKNEIKTGIFFPSLSTLVSRALGSTFPLATGVRVVITLPHPPLASRSAQTSLLATGSASLPSASASHSTSPPPRFPVRRWPRNAVWEVFDGMLLRVGSTAGLVALQVRIGLFLCSLLQITMASEVE